MVNLSQIFSLTPSCVSFYSRRLIVSSSANVLRMVRMKRSRNFKLERKKNKTCEEKYVWPWVGVVANIPTKFVRNGWRVGKSGSMLRDELTLKGFNPKKVEPLWNCKGHSGYALVKFHKDFEGFENAMKFERSFGLDGHGKRDYEKGIHLRDEKLYGWVARETDYNGEDVVGKHVQKYGDLKTMSEIEEEEKRKMKQLVENMSQSIEMKKIKKQELEEKVDLTSLLIESVKQHNIDLTRTHKEEIEKMHKNMQDLYKQIMLGHETSMSELETQREKLEERARRIEPTRGNEADLENSSLKREMDENQKAIWKLNVADEEAIKLAEKHQKEKEKLHEKIMEMESKLNERQELELEIEKLKGNTNVMKHMLRSDGDAEFVNKIAKTQIELKARETALQDRMMSLSQKERVTNDEYQDVRKEMIQVWNRNEGMMREEHIRVKRMGQLNPDPFSAAVEMKYRCSNSWTEKKARELCSLWESHIGNVQWHPFRVDESDGTPKRVVDKNDEKLLKLKNEYGEEVYNEVIRAKQEIEDNNPSGSYVVLELWNYLEDSKATLEEAAEVLSDLMAYVIATRRNR